MIDRLSDPFTLFGTWIEAAKSFEINDPNAMTVATTTSDGRPSARIVLLKSWDIDGFVFYTNLDSRKSLEIAANPHVALLFHWKTLKRQIRIEGAATPVAEAEADDYFTSRPRLSRIGAWASDQSRPLADRSMLEQRLESAIARYADGEVPRPPHWSGWRVRPEAIEFWEDRDFRLHDRVLFTRRADQWESTLLYP